MTQLSKETLAEIGTLALKLRHNPKTKRSFTKLVKEVAPDISFPDADIDDLRDEIIADRAKEKEDRENERLTARLAAERNELAHNYDEENLKKIEDVMVKKGLSSYQDAAVLYAHENPPVPARPAPSANLP